MNYQASASGTPQHTVFAGADVGHSNSGYSSDPGMRWSDCSMRGPVFQVSVPRKEPLSAVDDDGLQPERSRLAK